MPAEPSLLISILSLGRPENVMRQLTDLPDWLAALSVSAHIAIRNNDPRISFDAVAERAAEINALYPDVRVTLVTDVPNNGFGGGHNSNFALAASDYVLILNDDIGFPHMSWLSEAMSMLEREPAMAAIAAEENPRFVNALFGHGQLPGSFHLQGLAYGEASILLCRRSALAAAGGFHPDYAWAMCEDADLSLRLQQLGYTIGYVSMPHQHWRSTSFNSLPGTVKSSIMEHNRAALFANWRESLAAGWVGRFEVFDLWSDGIGDVFCALPHVAARLAGMTAEQRANVIVNTNHPQIFGWLGVDDIRIEAEKDIMRLRQKLAPEGIATLRTTRETNFSLPLNIHALLAGGLGIASATKVELATFSDTVKALRAHGRLPAFSGRTAVLHLEFGRDHDGRALTPAWSAKLLELCTQTFETVVLVGEERRLAPPAASADAKIVDLQGKLSLSQLASVMARAEYFVGIDSFPAHLAQALGLSCGIFFGAIHPLTRCWDRGRVWPLMAQLPCIGCYHAHLEPSVPFCMRRDKACTWQLDAAVLAATLQQMVEGRAYDFVQAETTLLALQARLIKLTKFHPAPPQRVFRAHGTANEAVSNLVYRMTDQLGELLRGQYQTSTVNALVGQVQELQSQVFAAKVELDDTRRQLREAHGTATAKRPWEGKTTALLQIQDVELDAVRCRLTAGSNWIEAEATDDDPQLLLPPIFGRGGKVQLRLSCVAEPHEALQIYWALDDDPFSPENLRTVQMDAGAASVNLVMDLAEGQILRLRIDPITGIGSARLHGTLGGTFSFAKADGAACVVTDLPAANLAEGARKAERGGSRQAGRTGRRSAVH